ncbi:FAD-dependent oxidoreductase [Pseudothioclava arenosa]|uniref:Pyridine nucleotide-disulfide oxidoreductase n=1 Tax=Pseudothioclava arenosa TaxID=1795308 RepID=A0A2A4CQD0_9RHOB|nr:bifunctional TVP38/TMEM64 family protein/FAD-dependent oxidoreductase [Pseudothioclava arenosa]PCD76530.1 pyridine nucleotide-disulfide oxidoreductase [Pseudothioclava arenosa]
MRKPLLFLVLIVVALAALAVVAEPDLARLQDWRAALEDLRAARPVALAGGFFAAYVGVTALSLPLAVPMTLLGGAVFGFWQALVLISFASTIGATLAFLAARYLARDWVRAKLGGRLAAIERGVARDGGFFLFSLRLIPVVPFFAINLAFGLTGMRVARFYGISQIGMLPGTAAYVAAGAQLGQIQSLSGILSPGLIAAFVAIGLLPWVARAALAVLRRRRALRGYTRPARFDRNLIVIGAGAAGLVAAYVGAAAKARVTLIEAERMGGDCLNSGCVPSKALIASARAASEARAAADLGIHAAPRVDFPAVMARVQEVIAQVAPHDSVERYEGLGVEVLRGHARLVDPWTVEVAGRRLSARGIILATGAAPVLPDLPGLATVAPLTSETLWDYLAGLPAPPARLAILGGGPIGCEIAQALAQLGAGVTLIEAGPRLLPREEPEASAAVDAALRRNGVEVLLGQAATRCGTDDGRWIELSDGRRIGFDALLVAVGRRARLTGFGLEELGLPVDRVIETNAWLQTLMPHIYAAGDAAGPLQLTNAAGHQGWVAAANALARPFWRFRADAAPIPAAVFTSPELARVGLTEAEVSGPHEVVTYPLADLDRAIAEGRRAGFVKIVTPKGSDRILGVTVLGPHAAEIIAEFALAMRHRMGLGKILATPHVYPSWAEAAKNASGRWKQGHVSPRLLRLAQRFMDWRRG